jgi:hypothetical protein
MAETNLRDVTDAYIRAGQGVQRPTPLVVCELKSAKEGTICFPVGAGFGCGLSLTLTAGAKFSLKTYVPVRGLPFNVEVAAEFTVSVSATYNSNRCEYCRPKVCFENSRLSTYECERFLGFWSWTTIDTVFVPVGPPLFITDCTPNDPLCNCPRRIALLESFREAGGKAVGTGIGGELGARPSRTHEIGSAPSSRFVSPSIFRPAREPAEFPAEEVVELASDHIEGFFAGEATAIGVLTAEDDVSWLSEARPEAPTLTLLSRDSFGEVSARGGRLPILAAGPCVPNARAEVEVDAEDAEGSRRKLFAGPAIVKTGRATTVWADVDLGDANLKPGARGNVRVTLFDESDCPVATVRERFAVRFAPEGRARRPRRRR